MYGRQYERADCVEEALVGQELGIGFAYISTGNGADCDSVACFGNPSTKNTVWVPYNSFVEIEGQRYKITKGKSREAYDRNPHTYVDLSTDCLLNSRGELHNMFEFDEKTAKVVELAKPQLKMPNRLERILEHIFG